MHGDNTWPQGPEASDPMSDHGDNTPPQGVKHITLVSADQSMQVYFQYKVIVFLSKAAPPFYICWPMSAWNSYTHREKVLRQMLS